MSVMSMFQNLIGSGQGGAAPAAGQASAGNNNAPAGGPGNGTVPQASNTPITTPNPADPAALQAGKTGGESPLAGFSELWKIDDKSKAGEISLSPTFNIEPAKIAEAAKTLDFARVVSPEMMQKALGGDAQAMAAAMNAVTQAAYTQSAVATARIVEAALAKQGQQFQAFLPGEVRRMQVSEQIKQDNPIFNNPAVAPMLSLLEGQLATKYPQASAAEISQQAKTFLTGFAEAIAGKSEADNAGKGGKSGGNVADDDWTKFFSGSIN